MIKTMATAAVLLASCVVANANALHLNPAQPGSAANMATFGRTSVPIGHYEYCQKYQDRCSLQSGDPQVELSRVLWSKIVEVNDRINRDVKPLTDMQIFGVEERWEYPDQVGDCEDYALQKRRILSSMGIPLGALLLTVGRDADGGGHAVLTVVTDLGDFILDNVEQRVLRWQDAELTYLKRQSSRDPKHWESLRPG